jgi:putative sigma-54 modulation protein
MIVKGRHMAVTPALQEHAEEKIGKVARIVDHMLKEAEVELYVEKNPSIENNQVAEVTIWTKGPVVRAKEASTDMYAAIDMAADKLRNQLRRVKGKMVDRHHSRGHYEPTTAGIPADVLEETKTDVVKRKRIEVKPMSMDEAILQLELLGHDFFVFTSPDTDDVNVIYRRNDGEYGLIEPVNE